MYYDRYIQLNCKSNQFVDQISTLNENKGVNSSDKTWVELYTTVNHQMFARK